MKITATTRTLQGTGASRRLRNAGRTTGIVYGGKDKPVQIEFNHNEIFHALRKEAFHASVLDLELDGKAQQVLLRDYQMHPFKPLVLHVDLQRVDAKSEIQMKVPLHFTGADVSPAVKLSAAIISHVTTEVTIACLPAKLPEFITVDLSAMVAGKSLHVSDLVMPEGVRAIIKAKSNPVVATASAAVIEEEKKA